MERSIKATSRWCGAHRRLRGRTRPLNVIGISAFFHDAACCLMSDGELVAAAEEERFTRLKHDSSLPVNAFKYCLAQGDLDITDIDCVAYYEVPRKKLSRQLWASLPNVPLASRAALHRLDARRAEREIVDRLGYSGPIELVEHHLSHSASSFYYSGFDDAAILIVDGVGEWATMSYGRASGNDIEHFEEVHFPHSIGLLYSTVTSYLGFEVNDAEYKIMGLAPYGKPAYVEEVRRLLRNGPGGQFQLELEYFAFLEQERMYSQAFIDLFGKPPRMPESRVEQFHKDVARSVQVVLEEFLLDKVRYLKTRVASDNLCMAGGVALNCVANGRVLRDGPFKRLFVQPAAGDSGGALGAAAVAHARLTGQRPSRAEMTRADLGPCYSSKDVEALIKATGVAATDCRGDRGGLIARTAACLADGKVVGWFQGRMEFGPRALGHRSILADPRIPTMRDKINAQVKKREGFRPFAPAVLEHRAHEHFDLDHASRFMLETCQVKSELLLPAITHVDGSARVQTVSACENPLFAELIAEFERLTSCPILLNTSFNLRGEPIVLTPFDAFYCFVRSDIDVLVLEDFIVTRDAITPFLQEISRSHGNGVSRRGRQASVSDRAYAFI